MNAPKVVGHCSAKKAASRSTDNPPTSAERVKLASAVEASLPPDRIDHVSAMNGHAHKEASASSDGRSDEQSEGQVNPLHALSEKISKGQLDDNVHFLKVTEGNVVVRQGEPSSISTLVHPSTWTSAADKGHDNVLYLDGKDHVHDFKDKGTESRKRDELKMAAHELKTQLKGQFHHHDPVNGPKTEVQDELDRLSSREASQSTANGTTAESRQSSYATVQTHPDAPSPTTVSTHLARPPSPRLHSHQHDEQPIASTSTAPLPEPVLNAPGLAVTNSRVAPTQGQANGKTSPRLVPIDSLTRPITPPPSNKRPVSSQRSQTSPTRSSHSRQQNRTSPLVGSSEFSASPRSTHTRHRSHSQVPTIMLNNDPNQIVEQKQFTSEPEEIDDVQQSIAAKTEQIRKERAERKLEREREQAEAAAQAAKANRGPGGAPIAKRRSTGRPGEGVLVGNLIGQDHANYVLMYNMLTGIRIGVSRCQAKPKRPLTPADYTARHKFSFDIVGNELTPSVKYDFKFKDYAPWVFRELREFFYLDPSDYLVSLTAKYILSELGSPGKSGSFFYFSRDYRFIIKTIRPSEHKFLLKILKDYHEHIKNNPHTLLSRFYGLHRVKLPRGKKIHFVIMNNLFPPHRDIHETYDLKGSSVGRILPESKAATNPRAILKDLNWLERGRHFLLGPEKKALFEEQLRRDTELLQRLGIMDYSLLTGIHNVVRGNADNLRDGMLSVFQPEQVKVSRRDTQLKRDANASAMRKAVQQSDPKALADSNQLPSNESSERKMFLFYQDEGGMRATDEMNEELPVIYYLGIIDILTPYNWIKKVEHVWRSCQFNKHQISAVPPREYGDRFLAFIYSLINGNDESRRPSMWEPPPEDERVKSTAVSRVQSKVTNPDAPSSSRDNQTEKGTEQAEVKDEKQNPTSEPAAAETSRETTH